MRQSPKAKTPRNVDPGLTADEARESFKRKLPEVDIDDLFANLLDRQRAREFNMRVSRMVLLDAIGRAFPSDAAEPVKYWHQQLVRLNEHDARIVGNLGAIESLVSDDQLKLLRTLMGVGETAAAMVLGRVLRVPAEPEKGVVLCNTEQPALPK